MRNRTAFQAMKTLLLYGFIIYAGFSVPVSAQFAIDNQQNILTAGIIPGNEDNRDVEIREIRMGRGHYFRNNIGFFTEFSLYSPHGYRGGESVNTTAFGLAFAIRWHFLNRPSFSIYADWGMGAMYGIDAFPPHGTKMNGTPHFGLGLSLRLTESLRLMSGIRHVHMSNGRGIVADNPSFDGLGGYIGVSFQAKSRKTFPALCAPQSFGNAEIRLRAEALFKRVDDENSPGGLLSADVLLSKGQNIHMQVAYGLAKLADESIWDAAVYLYYQNTVSRFAVGYMRREFSVFTSDFAIWQFDYILNDVSTIEFAGAYEVKNLSDDQIHGGLSIAVYPIDFVALTSGVGYSRSAEDLFSTVRNTNDAGFLFTIEASPGFMAALGLSTFVQKTVIDDEVLIGIRYLTGSKGSLRERHRIGGLIPMQ